MTQSETDKPVHLVPHLSCRCSQTQDQCSVVLSIPGIRGAVTTTLHPSRLQAHIEFHAHTKRAPNQRHVLQLTFAAPVDPGPRVEINSKNSVLRFRKAIRGSWDVLPNTAPEGGTQKKKKKKKKKKNGTSGSSSSDGSYSDGSYSDGSSSDNTPVNSPLLSSTEPETNLSPLLSATEPEAKLSPLLSSTPACRQPGPFSDDLENDLYRSLLEGDDDLGVSLLSLDDDDDDEDLMPAATPARERGSMFQMQDDDAAPMFDDDFSFEDDNEGDELAERVKPGSPRAQQLQRELKDAMVQAKRQHEAQSRTRVTCGGDLEAMVAAVEHNLVVDSASTWTEIEEFVSTNHQTHHSEWEFKGCRLHQQGVLEQLSELLQRPQFDTVTSLDLSFCGLSTSSIGQDWLVGSSVVQLNVSGNDLGDQGAAALASAMGQAAWTSLDVSNCAITADGANLIVGAALQSHLVSLLLDDNPIGDEGATHVADALSSSSCTLETVGVSNCRIRDDGIRLLCTALALTKAPLSMVDMSHNQLSPQGHSVLQGVQMVKPLIVLSCPPAATQGSRRVRRVQRPTQSSSHMLDASEWPQWDQDHPLLQPPTKSEGTFDLSQPEIELVFHASKANCDEVLRLASGVVETRLELKECADLWTPVHPVASALGSAVAHAVNLILAGPKLPNLVSNYGLVQHRVGLARMAALDLLVSIAAIGSPFLDSVLTQTNAPVHAMSMLYWNVWSNPVHVAVERLMQCCLTSDKTELIQTAMTPVILRSIAHAHQVLSTQGKPLFAACGFTTQLVAISQALLAAERRTGLSLRGEDLEEWNHFVQEHMPVLHAIIQDKTPCGGAPRGLPAQSFMEWTSGLY
eukprot:TRINITY_DN5467_c0_g1_i1.p1 TRINITY_DN5467_c0_g1~~TRINITY_DN5467_c0_g1_i1.p1  ORF type:complete len:854 (-),score=173.20 TRINITY_DN5467_c0_g1_i1:164-2725(-)